MYVYMYFDICIRLRGYPTTSISGNNVRKFVHLKLANVSNLCMKKRY